MGSPRVKNLVACITELDDLLDHSTYRIIGKIDEFTAHAAFKKVNTIEAMILDDEYLAHKEMLDLVDELRQIIRNMQA